MALAAVGDTWGISGPTFLLAYLVSAAAVWVAGARARRAVAAEGSHRPVGDLSAHPHDIAYLNGGAELAVFSAMTSMHRSGTITTVSRGSVLATAPPGGGADALERAVHYTAASPMTGRRLRFHRPVAEALRAIDMRLVGAGLLMSAEQRRRHRTVGWWMLAVAGVGLVRLLAGIAAARPVGYLFVAMGLVAVVGVVQLTRAPRRTRLGDRALADLRRAHHDLSPQMRPDWTTYGPAGAALGVAIFGTGALWASDPEFAHAIAAQRASTSSSSDSGGSSGDGGGGGCGGGGCGG